MPWLRGTMLVTGFWSPSGCRPCMHSVENVDLHAHLNQGIMDVHRVRWPPTGGHQAPAMAGHEGTLHALAEVRVDPTQPESGPIGRASCSMATGDHQTSGVAGYGHSRVRVRTQNSAEPRSTQEFILELCIEQRIRYRALTLILH